MLHNYTIFKYTIFQKLHFFLLFTKFQNILKMICQFLDIYGLYIQDISKVVKHFRWKKTPFFEQLNFEIGIFCKFCNARAWKWGALRCLTPAKINLAGSLKSEICLPVQTHLAGNSNWVICLPVQTQHLYLVPPST